MRFTTLLLSVVQTSGTSDMASAIVVCVLSLDGLVFTLARHGII